MLYGRPRWAAARDVNVSRLPRGVSLSDEEYPHEAESSMKRRLEPGDRSDRGELGPPPTSENIAQRWHWYRVAEV